MSGGGFSRLLALLCATCCGTFLRTAGSHPRPVPGFFSRYTPKTIEIEHKLQPFIPDYIPAVGDIDAFLKVRSLQTPLSLRAAAPQRQARRGSSGAVRALPCPAGAASRREAGQPGAAGAGRALGQAVGPHRAGPVADGELQATQRHRESALAVCRLRHKRCILLFVLSARLQCYGTSGNLALRAENTDLIL